MSRLQQKHKSSYTRHNTTKSNSGRPAQTSTRGIVIIGFWPRRLVLWDPAAGQHVVWRNADYLGVPLDCIIRIRRSRNSEHRRLHDQQIVCVVFSAIPGSVEC